MGTFVTHEYDGTGFTEARLTAIVETNGGFVAGFGYGYSCPGRVSGRVGQWQLRLVDTRGMGNHGSVIVTAAGRDAFEVQLYATRRILRRMAEENDHDDRGNFATVVVPLLYSPCVGRRGLFLFEDERWRYFAYNNANYLRVDDGRHRLWVQDKRIIRRSSDRGVYFSGNVWKPLSPLRCLSTDGLTT